MLSPSELIPSGVPGLDAVLGGGLRRGHLYFVEGSPGTGKTTLAMQFVLEGVRQGESGLVVSLAETADEIEAVAASHGWSLDGIAVHDLAAADHTEASSLFDLSEVELDARVQRLLAEMERLAPRRLVLDALSGLRALGGQPADFRRQIEVFRAKAKAIGCTVLILDDSAGDAQQPPRSLAWGVLRLEQRIGDFGAARRRLCLPKLRGQPSRGGFHDIRIQTGGMTVFPRLPPLPAVPIGAADGVTSGNPALDAMLGGGLLRGTSVGVIGPPGSGKSTLATLFALAAADRGERVAFYLFDEAEETCRRRAASQGLGLDAAIAGGAVALNRIEPSSRSPGELACEIAAEVGERGARLVIIDSLNGLLQALPDEHLLHLHVHALLRHLCGSGALVLLTLAHPFDDGGACGGPRAPLIGLGFVTDAVIAQRRFEAHGEQRYAVSVLKKRYGDHERVVREYRIGAGGIQIGAPLLGQGDAPAHGSRPGA